MRGLLATFKSFLGLRTDANRTERDQGGNSFQKFQNARLVPAVGPDGKLTTFIEGRPGYTEKLDFANSIDKYGIFEILDQDSVKNELTVGIGQTGIYCQPFWRFINGAPVRTNSVGNLFGKFDNSVGTISGKKIKLLTVPADADQYAGGVMKFTSGAAKDKVYRIIDFEDGPEQLVLHATPNPVPLVGDTLQIAKDYYFLDKTGIDTDAEQDFRQVPSRDIYIAAGGSDQSETAPDVYQPTLHLGFINRSFFGGVGFTIKKLHLGDLFYRELVGSYPAPTKVANGSGITLAKGDYLVGTTVVLDGYQETNIQRTVTVDNDPATNWPDIKITLRVARIPLRVSAVRIWVGSAGGGKETLRPVKEIDVGGSGWTISDEDATFTYTMSQSDFDKRGAVASVELGFSVDDPGDSAPQTFPNPFNGGGAGTTQTRTPYDFSAFLQDIFFVGHKRSNAIYFSAQQRRIPTYGIIPAPNFLEAQKGYGYPNAVEVLNNEIWVFKQDHISAHRVGNTAQGVLIIYDRDVSAQIGAYSENGVLRIGNKLYFISENDVFETDGHSLSPLTFGKTREDFRAFTTAQKQSGVLGYHQDDNEIVLIIGGSIYFYSRRLGEWYGPDVFAHTPAQFVLDQNNDMTFLSGNKVYAYGGTAVTDDGTNITVNLKSNEFGGVNIGEVAILKRTMLRSNGTTTLKVHKINGSTESQHGANISILEGIRHWIEKGFRAESAIWEITHTQSSQKFSLEEVLFEGMITRRRRRLVSFTITQPSSGGYGQDYGQQYGSGL